MKRLDLAVYCLGVVIVALTGFFCPLWYLGFVPLGAGTVWAAYFLIPEDARGAARPPR